MAFSINTNVASLQAQNYLRVNSAFQQKTINRVTSGLRVVNSGDDAAGLAIANTMRSDEAVLNQGVRNANDGLSQLQIADGGMSNISQLLDRARTLATQSASDTFTGDRTVLQKEFQSVLDEIDRQSQAIGLNQGGTFAKSLSVFIGGGKADATGSATSVVTNGSVSVDLSASTVDTQSLGLKGFVAGYQTKTDSGLYDLGSSSYSSVQKILAAATPATDLTNTNYSRFVISGPGFSDGSAINVDANISNVSDTATLAAAINSAIATAGSQNSAAAQALKAANIVAQVHTGTDGHQQLQFVSTGTAFEVTAGDKVANAFLGNIAGQTDGTSALSADIAGGDLNAVGAASAFVAAGDQQIGGAGQTATAVSFDKMLTAKSNIQTLTFTALDTSGKAQTLKVTLDTVAASADIDAAAAASTINAALQATDNKALQSILVTTDPGGAKLAFSSSSSKQFTVSIGVAQGGAAHGMNAGAAAVFSSDSNGTGGSASIIDQASAKAAVTALSNATAALGSAQAVVGRGQNQFNYAINLAQSQVTNMAAAESQIRDADLAAESANLTKAQILIQAGVAALAQANSAPQQVLTLLQR